MLASLRACVGCGCGGDGDEKKAADDLKRFVPMRIEPKTYFANERTLLKWINLVRACRVVAYFGIIWVLLVRPCVFGLVVSLFACMSVFMFVFV